MNDERPADPACLIWRGKVLVRSAQDPEPLEVSARAFAPAAPVVAVSGAGGGVATYLLESPDEASAAAALNGVAPDAVFADVMIELGRYDLTARYKVVRAIAIERWSNRYRFCPACGYALAWSNDSVAKVCANPQRMHRHFPRLDPAIIVLVTDGERVLLGRAARWPPGWYSTLAGFVEPGETLEAAIRREVFEEAGITVDATRYFGSESWPFPRSLMLGFFAQAQTSEISRRDSELEDARWFDAAQLRELQSRMKLTRPFFDTIARRLIDTWLAEHPVP
jgi:NAD+ diphosphatase